MAEHFDEQYAFTIKPVFRDLAQREIAKGADPAAFARRYAERGKPDFTLAYLLEAALPDEEKRELLAHAYDRRAALSEAKAGEMHQRFHTAFPLVLRDAKKDRATARQVREGA
jgi:predicted nucleotidyltransferase